MSKKINRSDCAALDAADKLAPLRDAFILPADKLNFDGNSLGSLPRQTPARLLACTKEEWGGDLIASWSKNAWFEAPLRVGNKLAKLLGAEAGEVLIADSVSVNIFKALTAAFSLRPGRRVMLSESGNFPTDLYLMEGLANFSKLLVSPAEGASESALVNKVVAPEEVLNHLTEEVAVLLLTHVHYKTAEMKDMAAITAAAREKGILVIWDLSHSVGSVPLDLKGAKADFAVGCGYKFLNGGPGAPAFIYVAKRHQASAMPVLSGWMGHQDPFAFTDDYQAAAGIERFRCGTPGILGLAALESGIDLFLDTDIQQLRVKAIALSRLFMELMQDLCARYGFQLVSPREDEKRGGHVSYFHPNGHAIYQAIKQRGIISDYRTPGVLRFGITPMYLRFVDVYQAVEHLHKVMENKEWDVPEYQARAAIT